MTWICPQCGVIQPGDGRMRRIVSLSPWLNYQYYHESPAWICQECDIDNHTVLNKHDPFSYHACGYIYLIQAQLSSVSRRLKIGHVQDSDGAKKRLSQLQVGCPVLLKILSVFPGGVEEEKRLHKVFRPYHERGEWFKLVGPVIAFRNSAQKYYEAWQNAPCVTEQQQSKRSYFAWAFSKYPDTRWHIPRPEATSRLTQTRGLPLSAVQEENENMKHEWLRENPIDVEAAT